MDGICCARSITARTNTKAYLEATIKTCGLRLKAHEVEAAFQDYAEFIDAGGGKMPAATWLELCKGAEEKQDFERAFTEYQQLARRVSRRAAGLDRATQRGTHLPEETEPSAGRTRALSDRGSLSRFPISTGSSTFNPASKKQRPRCRREMQPPPEHRNPHEKALRDHEKPAQP